MASAYMLENTALGYTAYLTHNILNWKTGFKASWCWNVNGPEEQDGM